MMASIKVISSVVAMNWSSRWILFLLVSGSYCFELPSTYDSSTRPNNGGVADVVNVSIQVVSIGRINENESTFTISFFLRSFWTDKRLANLVERETVFVDSHVPPVWTPALNILNNVKTDLPIGDDTSSTILKLKPDGTLDFSKRYSETLYCNMNFFKYPFGKQSCELKLSSNGYTTVHLTLLWHGLVTSTNGLSSVDAISLYDPHYSLRSIDQEAWREIQHSLGQVSLISVTFHLTRYPFAELMRVLVPTLLFAILSYIITFFLFSLDEKQFRKNLMLVCTNAMFLLLTVIFSQVALITRTPASLTSLDFWTGTMFFLQLMSFIVSIERTVSPKVKDSQRDISTGQECSEESKRLHHEVPRISRTLEAVRIGIPTVLFIFVLTYMLFCVS